MTKSLQSAAGSGAPASHRAQGRDCCSRSLSTCSPVGPAGSGREALRRAPARRPRLSPQPCQQCRSRSFRLASPTPPSPRGAGWSPPEPGKGQKRREGGTRPRVERADSRGPGSAWGRRRRWWVRIPTATAEPFPPAGPGLRLTCRRHFALLPLQGLRRAEEAPQQGTLQGQHGPAPLPTAAASLASSLAIPALPASPQPMCRNRPQGAAMTPSRGRPGGGGTAQAQQPPGTRRRAPGLPVRGSGRRRGGAGRSCRSAPQGQAGKPRAAARAPRARGRGGEGLVAGAGSALPWVWGAGAPRPPGACGGSARARALRFPQRLLCVGRGFSSGDVCAGAGS